MAARVAERKQKEELKRQKEIKRQQVIREIENTTLVFRLHNMSKLDFAKVAKIELVKIHGGIYEDANHYYYFEALDILNDEICNSDFCGVGDFIGDIPDYYLKQYRKAPSFKRFFDYKGIWKEISNDALVAYIRHNYTNYDLLLQNIKHDEEAYLVLKERVNQLIINILSLTTDDLSLPYFGMYKSSISLDFISSWKWDYQNIKEMEIRYKDFKKQDL